MRVRYYGHVGSLSGYGRAAADMCMALLSTGKIDLEISPMDYRPDQARIALAGAREVLVPLCKKPEQLQEPDVVIVHTLPGDISGAYDAIGEDPSVDLVPFVAYTTWEGISAPTSILRGYDAFEQIWMPSSKALRTFIAADDDEDLPDDRRVIPHAFDVASLEARRLPRSAVPERFSFYYIGAWNSRKNPAGLIRAWAMAFGPNDPVSLTLHCPGAASEQFGVALHQTGLLPADMAPVVLSNESISESEILRMHASYDCFVTASRGEAWNLPAFDALIAGRMIIVPQYHGSDDYLSETTAWRVPGMMAPATVDVQITSSNGTGMNMRTIGAQGLTSRDRWIEPALCDIADAMSVIASEHRRDLHVFYDIARYSYEAVGKLALAALEDIIK